MTETPSGDPVTEAQASKAVDAELADIFAEPVTETESKTFTSDDVQKVIKERLARQSHQYGMTPAEAKALKAEHEALKQASLTDTERATTEAYQRGKSEAESAYKVQLAKAEIRALLAGVVDSPADVVDDLDMSRFLTDSGEVDTAKVDALKTRLGGSKKVSAPRTHGNSSNGVHTPRTPAEAFAAMMEAQGI